VTTVIATGIVSQNRWLQAMQQDS